MRLVYIEGRPDILEPGIVDQDVETAQTLSRCSRDACASLNVAHVLGKRHGAAAGLFDQGPGLSQALYRSRGYRHVRTGLGQGASDRLPYAAACSRNEGAAAGKVEDRAGHYGSCPVPTWMTPRSRQHVYTYIQIMNPGL
jgi:hypothetical protein